MGGDSLLCGTALCLFLWHVLLDLLCRRLAVAAWYVINCSGDEGIAHV